MDSCREKGVGSVDEIHTPDIHTPGDDDDQIRMRIRAEPETDEKELVRGSVIGTTTHHLNGLR
mgnify:CR=1 FL=1